MPPCQNVFGCGRGAVRFEEGTLETLEEWALSKIGTKIIRAWLFDFGQFQILIRTWQMGKWSEKV